MSIDFSKLTGWSTSKGAVTQVTDSQGRIIWMLQNNKPIILEVEKITSDTYAGETTYTGEQFILLDIYPKSNGTVKVTYGGLTKTITDTSGAEEPNAQQVFFGTFNGVSDSVETPASGELTVEGDCYAFACGRYAKDSNAKNQSKLYYGLTAIKSFGDTSEIPDEAFEGYIVPANNTYEVCPITEVDITEGVRRIGHSAFAYCDQLTRVSIANTVEIIDIAAFAFCDNLTDVTLFATTPPTLMPTDNGTYTNFNGVPCTFTVPKGCGNAYKTAEGWSTYADKIVEAS